MKVITKHSGRIERYGPKHPLNAIAATYRSVWAAACKHEGIAPDAKFVVFSDTNPYTPFVNNAAKMLSEAKREYDAGGYVGLQLGSKP